MAQQLVDLESFVATEAEKSAAEGILGEVNRGRGALGPPLPDLPLLLLQTGRESSPEAASGKIFGGAF